MIDNRTPLFLMANLGAEVSRVFSYKEKGDAVNVERASLRAKKIISEIMQFEEMKPREKEIEKIVDVIDSTVSNNGLIISKNDIENYFNPFALRFLSLQSSS